MYDSNRKNVIFSPQKGEINDNMYYPSSTQQKRRQVFEDSGLNSYNGSFNQQYPTQDRASMYRQDQPAERGSRPIMREVKILNLEDVSPTYQNENQQQQKSIFKEAPQNQQQQYQQPGAFNQQQQQQQPQQPTMNNPYFDSRYAGTGNPAQSQSILGQGQGGLDARSARPSNYPSNYTSPQKQGSPQKYHKVTVGMEGYEYENPATQGGPKIFGSEPKQSWRFGNSTFQYGAPQDQPQAQGQQNVPLYQQGRQANGFDQNANAQGLNPQQQQRGDNYLTPRGSATVQGGENVTRSSPNGAAIGQSPTADGRGMLPIQGRVPEGKSNIAQRPYAILKNIDDTALLPKQDNIVFEGPERYTVNSDFYAALFKKGEYLLELIRNQRVVILNCQQAIKNFNHQKESSLKNLIRLESEFMQGQGEDSAKSGQQIKKIESLATEIENCKKLAQDAEKLEDFFKRSVIARSTKKAIPDVETEITTTSDRIVKEANALEEHLRLMREFRKENSNSTRFEQKANQVLTDLNWHKDIYLESWNRIHNMFIVLADYFGLQIPELSQVAKKYNDVFNLSAYQSEIRIMEQYQSRLAQIKTQLSETATFMGGIYQVRDTDSQVIQIRKRDDYKRVIPEKKKVLENLRNTIKAFKFEIKSYRDPTNSKSLASQKVKHKISDSLAEELKQLGYKADNLLVVSDVFVEIEKEELLFQELYSSNLPRCQTKLFERADKISADADKGVIGDIEKKVDEACGNFNRLISDYLQLKTRLVEHSGNPEVQIILGSIIRDFIKRVDAQLVKCNQMNEKIFKLRYRGSKIETQLDELRIEAFQLDYEKFQQDLLKSYQTIDSFIQNQDNREKHQSACRKKNEKLKDFANKQVHDKTTEKIKSSAQLLAVYDENFCAIDECMAAAIKVKITVENLTTTTVKDFETGGVRSFLKDEGDVLAQAAELGKSFQSKIGKAYEATKVILEYYTPLFLNICQIYKAIINYFYDKDGVSIYSRGADNNNIANFRSFSTNVENLASKVSDKNLHNKLMSCLSLWESHIVAQFGSGYR